MINPDRSEEFEKRALALLGLTTAEDLAEAVEHLIRDFPKILLWIQWWMRDAHASMLFLSQRTMDPDVWDSIPDTTNAEESQHWKLYKGAGNQHELLAGCRALYGVAAYYERLYTKSRGMFYSFASEFQCNLSAYTEGTLIRYGKPEPWKTSGPRRRLRQKLKIKAVPHKTSLSIASKYKNDGRPPDTSAQLITKQAVVRAKRSEAALTKRLGELTSLTSIPSYVWEDSACWLDASLEILFAAIRDNLFDFSTRCMSASSQKGKLTLDSGDELDLDTPFLQELSNHFRTRSCLPDNALVAMELSKARNQLRKSLSQRQVLVGGGTGEDSVFVGFIASIFK